VLVGRVGKEMVVGRKVNDGMYSYEEEEGM